MDIERIFKKIASDTTLTKWFEDYDNGKLSRKKLCKEIAKTVCGKSSTTIKKIKCSICGKSKPTSKFILWKTGKNKGLYNKWCVECRKFKDIKRIAKQPWIVSRRGAYGRCTNVNNDMAVEELSFV